MKNLKKKKQEIIYNHCISLLYICYDFCFKYIFYLFLMGTHYAEKHLKQTNKTECHSYFANLNLIFETFHIEFHFKILFYSN